MHVIVIRHYTHLLPVLPVFPVLSVSRHYMQSYVSFLQSEYGLLKWRLVSLTSRNYCAAFVTDFRVTSSVPVRFAVASTPQGTGARAPNFYKRLGTRGTVSRRTANKKTDQTVPSRKRPPKRSIVLLEPDVKICSV